MATPAYPADLPGVLYEGNATQLEDNRIRFKPDRGKSIQRRGTTQRLDAATFAWSYTAAQYAEWLVFYGTTLGDGTLTFTMADPVDGLTKIWIYDTTPAQQRIDPDHYRVSATLTCYG